MKHANMLVLAAAGVAMAALAHAQETLPVGAVACLSLKGAQDYARYSQAAPDFAKDLLARASCYQVKEPVEVVAAGRPEQGYQAYKLLSGHKVWLPLAR